MLDSRDKDMSKVRRVSFATFCKSTSEIFGSPFANIHYQIKLNKLMMNLDLLVYHQLTLE